MRLPCEGQLRVPETCQRGAAADSRSNGRRATRAAATLFPRRGPCKLRKALLSQSGHVCVYVPALVTPVARGNTGWLSKIRRPGGRERNRPSDRRGGSKVPHRKR